ncbi:MAG: heme-binding domain-containing protein [Arcobacteraceae bacterium]|jgi:hypothetical protein|nr:heme-binding domain-containing protein [Arcobacteraceae bacterium]
MVVLKTIFKYLLGFFILIQVIPISYEEQKKVDSALEMKAPAEIMGVFKRSCYACHSNETVLPWYSHVAPFSWSISRHVDLGRQWLNFSTWETYSVEEKDKKMGEIYNAVFVAMPLRGYVSMHPEAELTPDERKMIRDWTGKAPF